MSTSDRVLWEEGMFLGPQHFQQWQRNIEYQIARRTRACRAHDYGLTDLSIDEQALLGGELALLRASGVFQDGAPFSCPDDDSLPAPRNLTKEVAPSVVEVEVAIGLADARTGNLTAAPEDAARSHARYVRTRQRVVDETARATEVDIQVGRKNLRLLLSGDPADDYTTLPIAKVRRTGAGRWAVDPEFIGTCLYASASLALMALIRRVYELSSAKRDYLRSRRGQVVGGAAQFSVIGAMNLLLEHTIATHLPAIAHAHHLGQVHPSDVYRDIACLAGAMSTFSLAERPIAALPYDHQQPTACFQHLLKAIDGGEVVQDDRCVSIPLGRDEQNIWTGRIADESLFDAADFYIAVRSDAAADKVIREFPYKAKLTSPDRLAEIRQLNTRGVRLSYISAAPIEIPQRGGMHYFRVQQDGEHWGAVRIARILSGAIPTDFPELLLECYAIRRPK